MTALPFSPAPGSLSPAQAWQDMGGLPSPQAQGHTSSQANIPSTVSVLAISSVSRQWARF